jgi:acetyl-CoA C-acetyltransferase
MPDAFVFDAVRTPRGRGKDSGSLYPVRPIDLLAGTLRALAERTHLDTRAVDDVVVGCVTQTGEQGGCIARFAALAAGYDAVAPGVTVNRFCGSGLEAVNHAAAMVASGFYDCVVAGGVESMSRVEMGSDGGALADARTQWTTTVVPQGISADLLATLHGFSRAEVDAFALESQRRAVAARDAGAFARSIVPVRDENGLVMLATDEAPRADTTLDQLAKLRPAFELMGRQFGLDSMTRRVYPEVERIDHVHTAGNSSGIVDGAAAVLVASKEKGAALGLRPRARIRAVALVGDEPTIMLTGPLPATRRVLARAGMAIGDIDIFEVNEAFAVVPLLYGRTFGIDPADINVNGGSIALGHPLGATGAMLLNTALDALEDRDLGTALITLCIGGGMGIATILERVG